MREVVDHHVPVEARVFGELERHDAAAGVEDEDVEAVGLGVDLFAGFGDGFEIRQVALQPGYLGGDFCAEFFFDIVEGALDGFFRDGEDEQFGEVVLQEREAGGVADPLAAAGDDADFAALVRGFFEAEAMLGFCDGVGGAAEVLGNGVFDGLHFGGGCGG